MEVDENVAELQVAGARPAGAAGEPPEDAVVHVAHGLLLGGGLCDADRSRRPRRAARLLIVVACRLDGRPGSAAWMWAYRPCSTPPACAVTGAHRSESRQSVHAWIHPLTTAASVSRTGPTPSYLPAQVSTVIKAAVMHKRPRSATAAGTTAWPSSCSSAHGEFLRRCVRHGLVTGARRRHKDVPRAIEAGRTTNHAISSSASWPSIFCGGTEAKIVTGSMTVPGTA